MIGPQFGQAYSDRDLFAALQRQRSANGAMGLAGKGYLDALSSPVPQMPQMQAPVSPDQAKAAGIVGALAALLGAHQNAIQGGMGAYLGGLQNQAELGNQNAMNAYRTQMGARENSIDRAKAGYGIAQDQSQMADKAYYQAQQSKDKRAAAKQDAFDKKASLEERRRQFDERQSQKQEEAKQRAREALAKMHPKTQREAEAAAAILFGAGSEEFKHASAMGASLEKFFTDNHWSPEERKQWWMEQEGVRQDNRKEMAGINQENMMGRMGATQDRIDARTNNIQGRIDARTQKVRDSIERNTLNHKKSPDLGPFGEADRAAKALRGSIAPLAPVLPQGFQNGKPAPQVAKKAPAKKSAPPQVTVSKNKSGKARYDFDK